MRIVHFSDIHAHTPFPGWRGLGDKRLLGTLNFYLRRARSHDWPSVAEAVHQIRLLGPDLVIYTGDLTTISDPAEFAQACEALQPLADDRRFEFLCIPGNHDRYIPGDEVRQCLAASFRRLNRDRWELADLPLCHEFRRARFLLVDESCPAPFYGSWGQLDERTRNWLAAQLPAGPGRSPQPAVLVGHFPLLDARGRPLSARRNCRGSEEPRAALRDGRLRLSLCGHIHHPFVRREASGSLEFCAGSLPQCGGFYVIDFDVANNCLDWRWVPVTSCRQAPPAPEVTGLVGGLGDHL